MKHRQIFFNVFLISIFSFFSCQSNSGFKVPGEREIINKNIASEYFAIADGYADLKKYDKAAQYYKLAMRDKGVAKSAYYKMARCYALAKNYKQAEEAYENLLKLDPDNTDIKLSLAYIHAMNGQNEKALSEYQVLVKENPDRLYRSFLSSPFIAASLPLKDVNKNQKPIELYYKEIKSLFI